MRRFLLFLGLIALIFSAIYLSGQLPAPVAGLAAEKYNAFSGVLHVRLSHDASAAFPGIVRWFNSCAAIFEKKHPGIYLRLLTGSPTVNEDIRLFLHGEESPGTLLPISDALPPPFSDAGSSGDVQFASPLACAGSVLITNGAPPETLNGITVGIWPGSELLWASICETYQPDAPAVLDRDTIVEGDFDLLYDQLLHGELGALPIPHKQLLRLIDRQSDGKYAELHFANAAAVTDQVLYAAIPRRNRDDSDARAALASEFITYLLTDECQQKLTICRLISVTGIPLYPTDPVLSCVEEALHQPGCIVQGAFSAPPDIPFENFLDQKISVRELMRQLRNADRTQKPKINP